VPPLLEVAGGRGGIGLLAPRFRARLRTHWLAQFEAAGIPAEPVLAYDEALMHPQAKAIGVLTEIPGAQAGLQHTLATPFTMSETPAAVRRPAPALDSDGAEIRKAFADTALQQR
jgi:crotonobetainyl-CoA:carnitine CoA-transferase CaiB-like acyl-CoA transferase